MVCYIIMYYNIIRLLKQISPVSPVCANPSHGNYNYVHKFYLVSALYTHHTHDCELRFFSELAIIRTQCIDYAGVANTQHAQIAIFISQSTLKSQKRNCFTRQLKPGLRYY